VFCGTAIPGCALRRVCTQGGPPSRSCGGSCIRDRS
jgi:hypothetical protein